MTTVLSNARPVARMVHSCGVCYGIIGKGDTYVRQVTVGDDGPQTFKCHVLCDAAYWKAHREAGLTEDDWPDWADSVRPIIETVLLALAGVPIAERKQ